MSHGIEAITAAQFARLIGPQNGPHPALHREVAWFASTDEKRVGAVVLDLFDRDYGWVMLADDGHGRLACVDLAVSLPSAVAAEAELTRRLAAREGG
jgi:hypothetical protein